VVLPFENVFYAQEIHNLGIKEQCNPETDFVPIQNMFSKINLDDLDNYGNIACNLIDSIKKADNEMENGIDSSGIL